MPPVVPILIFSGWLDAEDVDARRPAARTSRAAVRRYRKVASLYHKVDVNGERCRRPDDPARPLPDEPAPEADDRGGARANGVATRGLPRLRDRGRRGAVDADAPRRAARDAALDRPLPPRPARAARPRRARPEPGRRTLLPDPPHEEGRAAARAGAPGLPRLRRGGRGAAGTGARRVAARRARRVAAGRHRGARGPQLSVGRHPRRGTRPGSRAAPRGRRASRPFPTTAR